MILCFDKDLFDWRTVCLFNFDHTEELKQTGKRFAHSGLLRSISTTQSGGFIFLADDTIVGSVKFHTN